MSKSGKYKGIEKRGKYKSQTSSKAIRKNKTEWSDDCDHLVGVFEDVKLSKGMEDSNHGRKGKEMFLCVLYIAYLCVF